MSGLGHRQSSSHFRNESRAHLQPSHTLYALLQLVSICALTLLAGHHQAGRRKQLQQIVKDL